MKPPKPKHKPINDKFVLYKKSIKLNKIVVGSLTKNIDTSVLRLLGLPFIIEKVGRTRFW